MADTSVTIIGNLTNDPEIRYTTSGIAVTDISVAVTPRVRNGDRWEDGETSFYSVVIWRDYGEHVADSLQKGDRVVVIGTLAIERWESDDGVQRSKAKITASEVTPSLKWATAQVTRIRSGEAPAVKDDGKRGKPQANRAQSRSRRTTRDRETVPTSGGEFAEEAPF
jgi:single-strand DNA-binding protein